MSAPLPYVPLEAARAAGGLRMVLNAGAPGPWSEAAKGILRVKGIGYVPVAHLGGMENAEVVAWTGVANAPVAMFEDERPRSHWSEILLLAERLAPEPRLIPQDQGLRVRMMGICQEICGEDGLGWNRRLQLFDANEASARAKAAQKDAAALDQPNVPIARMRFRYSANADLAATDQRLIAILDHLTALLELQAATGSPWFVGTSMTAADIYWAAFSNLFAPMSPEVCPMPDYYRAGAGQCSPELCAALSSALIDHRDRTARIAFEVPMRF
jgi:glutathione S-transferase